MYILTPLSGFEYIKQHNLVSFNWCHCAWNNHQWKTAFKKKKNPTGSKVYGLVAGEWKVSSAKFSIGSGTTKPQVENVFGECYIWSYNGSHIITKWLVLLGCT